MLQKKCPWCEKRSSPYQLGLRPETIKPKWFQPSRKVKVCPHCSGALGISGRALWFSLLLLPVFTMLPFELLFEFKYSEVKYLSELVFICAVFGFLIPLLGCVYVKRENA